MDFSRQVYRPQVSRPPVKSTLLAWVETIESSQQNPYQREHPKKSWPRGRRVRPFQRWESQRDRGKPAES